MDFLSTTAAERQYSTLIGEVKEIMKDRMKSGFIPWLLQSMVKKTGPFTDTELKQQY